MPYEDTIDQIITLRNQGKKQLEISEILKLGRSTVSEYITRFELENNTEVSTSDVKVSHNEDLEKGTATYNYTTEQPVRSVEDAIKLSKIDQNVWFVKRCNYNIEERVIKSESGSTVIPVCRVNLQLERKFQRYVHDSMDGILNRFKNPTKPFRPQKAPQGDIMGVFCLFDTHFGKLAWGKEVCGKNYDLGTAHDYYVNAAEKLVGLSDTKKIGKIVLPIGNDFFHIDYKNNMTANGTPQDVDGRLSKIIETGFDAVKRVVDKLTEVAPVELLWVPGNHDRTTSWFLCKILEAWFRNDKYVTCDVNPNARKYLHWGKTLLGFTHGDKERMESLPLLMAKEAKESWAESICHEWIIGHMHRSRQMNTRPVDTFNGVVVRVVKALCGSDAYHYEHGYIGTDPAAEVYYYDKDSGYLGHMVARVED